MSDTEPKQGKYTADDWDNVRLSFSTSLMVDTKLLSLSQNLEITEWPIKGSSETASKYIDYTYEELQELPGLADKPERIDLLVDILRETIAFDDPFGDMVATVDAATQKEDNLGKSLDKLKIPKDFPIRLTNLSKDTKTFCDAEEIENLEQFARFAQNMAENIVVGGDFKELLSAFNYDDEDTIAKFLPFRPRHTGLHLQEAVSLVFTELSETEKYSLLKRYGKKLKPAQIEKATLPKDQVTQLETVIKQRLQEQSEYFEAQMKGLCKSLLNDITLERYFMVINDQEKELIANKIMAQFLKESGYMAAANSAAKEAAAQEAPKKKGGLFSRLFRKR